MATTTTSATSSIVTALGGGSGIDMAALATNLAAAQFAGRTDRLTTKSDTLDRQISAASSLKAMLLNLSTSLGDRVRSGDLSPQPNVANNAVAKTSLSGSTTPSGNYSLEVTDLATAQTLASLALPSATTAVGAGTLTLRFGTVSGNSFTADAARAPVDIAIASGATLADVARTINAAGTGVSAYIANTTEGAKLVLKGQEGATNGFVLETAETPGEEGLAALAWTPAAATARLMATAGDAAFRIDGLAMTSASNSVTDAVPGLTLTLTGTNAGAPTRISFADPKPAITEAMQDMTSALNSIASELAAATDPKTGDLSRDSGARALKSALSQLAGTIIMPDGGAARTLADLGLSTQRDGSFVLDTKRLAATLNADLAGAAAMFTTGLRGIYGTIDSLTRKASSASDPGSLGGSISRYATQKTQLSADKTKLIEQQEALRTQLVSRFAVADSRVGASKSTLSFLQNQIDAWNSSKN